VRIVLIFHVNGFVIVAAKSLTFLASRCGEFSDLLAPLAAFATTKRPLLLQLQRNEIRTQRCIQRCFDDAPSFGRKER
jgi:hypothetical protein